MKDWHQTKTSYYADFLITPTLIVIAFSLGIESTINLLVSIGVGFVAWTLAEYWIHRYLFHVIFRRGHWMHHIRPRAYDAAPAWLTAGIQMALLGSALMLGPIALGLFVGLEIGYFAYITVHDAIHHRHPRKARGWLKRRARAHAIHHRGKEVNFGVASSFWDRVFGTFDSGQKVDTVV